MAVITALTAQNTRGVGAVSIPPADFLAAQLRLVCEDIPPRAIKTGMVGGRLAITAVLEGLAGYAGPLVVDPVMVATSGDPLLEPDAEELLIAGLCARATVVTPNLDEAARFPGLLDQPAAWARDRGLALLLKDGHGRGAEVVDRLFLPDGGERRHVHPRIATRNTHGTGCTLSAALTARLARGQDLEEAVGGALDYVSALIARSAAHGLGGGAGPLLHGLR
jgi:hydroxymethylpyrimidine/phosphomethylpyrimidine kinase